KQWTSLSKATRTGRAPQGCGRTEGPLKSPRSQPRRGRFLFAQIGCCGKFFRGLHVLNRDRLRYPAFDASAGLLSIRRHGYGNEQLEEPASWKEERHRRPAG